MIRRCVFPCIIILGLVGAVNDWSVFLWLACHAAVNTAGDEAGAGTDAAEPFPSLVFVGSRDSMEVASFFLMTPAY
jgi:hypothetical protein